MSADKSWWVVSPEMSEVIPILDDGSGPLEYYQDAVCVHASTKRAAIVAGVREMKNWPAEARADDCNPFAGVTAEPAQCPHGVCPCDDCFETTGVENCETCKDEEDAP